MVNQHLEKTLQGLEWKLIFENLKRKFEKNSTKIFSDYCSSLEDLISKIISRNSNSNLIIKNDDLFLK